MSLQSSSKVKVEVSHHKLQDGEYKVTTPLVFVLDDLKDADANVKKEKKEKKDKKKGKKNNDGITLKNFGKDLQIDKIKSAQHMGLAWRCRFFSQINVNLVIGFDVFLNYRLCALHLTG